MLYVSMELSRERKIFIGIFGTALAALGIDQGLLGPSEAAAAPVTSETLITSAPAIDATAPVQAAGVGRTISMFAQRLQKFGDGTVDPLSGGDAFSVPAAWLAVEDTGANDAQTPQASVGPPTFRITSVMPTQNGGIAIIDGQTYRQGESVGDYVLEKVEPRSVVIRRGDRLFRVALAD